MKLFSVEIKQTYDNFESMIAKMNLERFVTIHTRYSLVIAKLHLPLKLRPQSNQIQLARGREILPCRQNPRSSSAHSHFYLSRQSRTGGASSYDVRIRGVSGQWKTRRSKGGSVNFGSINLFHMRTRREGQKIRKFCGHH